jgi:cytochrome oxidase Cu insertion factor (SCO1/SenC/PrrC family)
MVSTPRRIGFLHICWQVIKADIRASTKAMNTNVDNSADSIYAKIGSIAPDFKLTATNGQEIALSDFRGKRNVVLFFIREFI